MSKEIFSELNNVGDSEDGGFNTGHLWKLLQRFTEPHSAMMNTDGKLFTNDADIRDEAVNQYTNVFKPRVIKEGLEDIKDFKARQCKAKLETTTKLKTLLWSVEDVTSVLKQLRTGKSKNPYNLPNELF